MDKTLSSQGFGISNGVSTILGLLAGFVATETSKFNVVGALLSLLLTDPINDSFSIYISMKHLDSDEASNKFKETFAIQSFIQFLFLFIVFLSPSVYYGFVVSCFVGLLLLLYDYNNRLKDKNEIVKDLIKIFIITLLTFFINTLFYKFYNKKL